MTTTTNHVIGYLTDTYGERSVQRAQEAVEAVDPTGLLCTPRLLVTLCKGLTEPGENLAATLAHYRKDCDKYQLTVFDEVAKNLFGF